MHTNFVFLNLTSSVTVNMDFYERVHKQAEALSKYLYSICLVLTLRKNKIRTAMWKGL
jgi:hypothetical protein